MRAMKDIKAIKKAMRKMTAPGKHELMFRRAANHNVHMMTPHGRIVAGRKGRKG